MSSREHLNKTVNWPGPANYSLSKDISDATPVYQKITMQGRYKDRSLSNSPGPIYDTMKSSEAIK